MTFSDFISSLDPAYVQEQWDQLQDNELDNAKGTKYYIRKGKKEQPFKAFVYHLAGLKNAKVDFSSDDSTRYRFCEAYGFEIEERIEIYDQTERAQLDAFIKKLSDKELFRSYMLFCNKVLSKTKIDPYHVRFTIAVGTKARMIIGQRIVLSFHDSKEGVKVSFMLDNQSSEKIDSADYQQTFEFKSGGVLDAIFATITLSNWDDLPDQMEAESMASIRRYYDSVSGGRITWGTEAKTTNSALKLMAFDHNVLYTFIDQVNYYPLVIEYMDYLKEDEYATSTVHVYGENVQPAIQKAVGRDDQWLKEEQYSKEIILQLLADLPAGFKGAGTFRDFLEDKLLSMQDLNSVTIWKLGCNWDSGLESFYPYLKEHNILLGVEEYRFKMGDLVLITEGYQARAIAQVSEDMVSVLTTPEHHDPFRSYSIPIEDGLLVAKAKWRVLNEDEQFEYKLQKGIRAIQQEKTKKRVIELWQGTHGEKNNASVMNNITKPLNQILYGPPGTGKTYNTINKAIAICDADFDLNQDRSIVKDRFDELQKAGQILFTTFHQSMSYEDFIEGLKPLKPEEGDEFVKYEVVPGVFKKVCIEAAFSIAREKLSLETEDILDFSLAYDSFMEQVEEQLSAGEMRLKTKTGGEVLVDSVSDRGNVIIKHIDGSRSYTVSKQRLTKLNAEIKNLDDVSNINDQFREIIGGSNSTAYWTVLNAIRNQSDIPKATERKRTYTFEEKVEVVKKMDWDEYRESQGKPYVLIIDEINRGNVSQIFGELITLIEESKRAGKKEALQVQLPYSRDSFSVPPNLFIIGTMNTADRSVEALDVALRRRFKFDFLGPNYELEGLQHKIEGTESTLADLLKVINERIAFLKDEDHQIGHSYFLEKQLPVDLSDTFNTNVIPLLKEYFYNDYDKISLILGNGFIEIAEDWKPRFATDDEVMERSVYRVKKVGKSEIISAVMQCIGE
ncbi:McrB family protein [Ekhidna sp.]|uniref:McrB family protein n=1 Tax=Ekhidna sp. TaxID=2608089 RepID=UPI003B5AD3CD